ncbi:MAG: response regulator transcription factor [Elusimicrobiaceae bacterium]|nr:response regulator transcription factor [Elusimicrobiaceae bacterium]
MNAKIIICDDHKIFREGLRTLIEKETGFSVIAEADDGVQAVELARKLLPDVVIMDISMPRLNGIEAARKILAHNRHVKIIALSMHADRRFVKQLFTAGARAYLLKDAAFGELSCAINAVRNGKTYLSTAIADVIVRDYIVQPAVPGKTVFSQLTDREREVLQLFAEGRSTKQIATQLKLSVKTIETHRKQIMEKLDIHSIAGLTKYAIREGITAL